MNRNVMVNEFGYGIVSCRFVLKKGIIETPVEKYGSDGSGTKFEIVIKHFRDRDVVLPQTLAFYL
jgi:hypothetical protein